MPTKIIGIFPTVGKTTYSVHHKQLCIIAQLQSTTLTERLLTTLMSYCASSMGFFNLHYDPTLLYECVI